MFSLDYFHVLHAESSVEAKEVCRGISSQSIQSYLKIIQPTMATVIQKMKVHMETFTKTIELSEVELLIKETSVGLASNKCYPQSFMEELGNGKFENWSDEVKNNLLVKSREVCKCLEKFS